MIKVFGYVKTATNEPVVATKVKYCISPYPQTLGLVSYSRSFVELLTNEDGYFEVELAPQLQVTFIIPATGFQVTGILPDTGEIAVTHLGMQY